MFVRGMYGQLVNIAGLVLDALNIGTAEEPEIYLVARPVTGKPEELDTSEIEYLAEVPADCPARVMQALARRIQAGATYIDAEDLVSDVVNERHAAGVRA